MVREIYVLLPIAAVQMLLVLVPASWARRHCGPLRQLAITLAAGQCFLAAVALINHLLPARAGSSALVVLPGEFFSFLYDGTSSLMFLLVSFIGWTTCQYSKRYLDGEPNQGRYYRWMSFTIGAVSCMVLSADLLTFCLLWFVTSFGLHNLLVHYGDRPAAQRAAWTKFIVSRIGDLAVLVALCLFYPLVSTLHFSDLAAAALNPEIANRPTFQLATLALALGVMAKSAQIPFHTWLPLTMETPTPVSALMHAGIVNAGGYLLVRSSPLLCASMPAQLMLVIGGTFTACVASIVMLTQSSIKKKLAYSTIAQMGFMLMQCGLGAYSAAMLHILAHSLYKAYEFLSSGSVITRRAGMQSALASSGLVPWKRACAVMIVLLLVAWGMLIAVGQDPMNKPGGWLLTGVLCASLTYWLTEIIAVGKPAIVWRAGLTAVALLAVYATSFALVDGQVVKPDQPVPAAPLLAWLLALACFAGLFCFQLALMSPHFKSKLRTWQVHAANGFYIESWLRRRLWSMNS